MKRAISILAFFILLWGGGYIISSWQGDRERDAREHRMQRVIETISKEVPASPGTWALRTRLVEMAPMIAGDPRLFSSYETMLALPPKPRSVWLSEVIGEEVTARFSPAPRGVRPRGRPASADR